MSPIRSSLLLGAGAAASSYQIERSLRCNSSDSAKCARTYSTGSSTTTQTFSAWVKRAKLGATGCFWSGYDGSAAYGAYFQFDSADTITVILGGASLYQLTTTQVFRDPSSWYHIVLTIDTNNGTSSDRIRLYVNGSRVTTFSTASYPTSGYACQFAMGNANNTIGTTWGSSGYSFFDGYLADVHFIDGQALTPSSFTEVSATTGQLIPKAYTETFTGNSFWLKFADNSAATATTLGKDSSGLGNNWTPNNLSVTAGAGNDSLVDTPTSYGTDTGAGGEVRGNYATLNPLAGTQTLANGNLDFSNNSADSHRPSTIAMTTGKWYCEFTVSSAYGVPGLVPAGFTSTYPGSTSNSWGWYGPNGIYNNAGIVFSATYTGGDVVQIAFDADSGKLWFGKNGTWLNSGNPAAGTGQIATASTGTWHFAAGGSVVGAVTLNANFGQRPFAYTAPSGFKALCDTNLPAPVVAKPNTVFDTILYSGNNSTQSITSLAFNPDMVWSKCRNVGRSYRLSDAIRGSNVDLYTDTTASDNYYGTGSITTFTANGFNLDNSASSQYNTSGETYVSWCWDAGTSTVTNTQGSITSQVRANASSGFAVITGSTPSSNVNFTFGHNLGIAPSLVIYKHTAVSGNWQVYHRSGGGNNYNLNSTAGPANSGTWSGLDPTSTLITIPSTIISANSSAFVCYAFSPVAGYSSFGSYTGNGSADGPFVYTGFRPRWVMLKQSSGSGTGWQIHDTSRNTYNVMNNRLQPSNSDAESTYTTSDFLSNGFKLRDSDPSWNGNGATYIYAAFAENPFQFSRAR